MRLEGSLITSNLSPLICVSRVLGTFPLMQASVILKTIEIPQGNKRTYLNLTQRESVIVELVTTGRCESEINCFQFLIAFYSPSLIQGSSVYEHQKQSVVHGR